MCFFKTDFMACTYTCLYLFYYDSVDYQIDVLFTRTANAFTSLKLLLYAIFILVNYYFMPVWGIFPTVKTALNKNNCMETDVHGEQ